MSKRLVVIVKMVYDIVHNPQYKEKWKMRKEDFTRNRKMNFVQTIAFILTGIPRSLQAGLIAFMEEYAKEVQSYSKQAFSKGRLRLNPEAIKELFDLTAENFYKLGKYDTLRGYRILAVDGTKYNLPNSKELSEVYGEQITGGAPQVQAMGSCLYDVLNGILMDAQIHPLKTSERDIAVSHMNRLMEMEPKKELLLFDRGYPSGELIRELESRGLYYLMRCSREFCCGMKPTSYACNLTYTFKKAKYTATFRYIRLVLPALNEKTTEEILITNLPEKDFPLSEMTALYHLRWGIENKYDEVKNILEIENFSGQSDIVIRQDFYASMFLSNLAAIAAYDNREEIEKAHNTAENKYRYKQNINVTVSVLRDHVTEMLLVDSDRKRSKIFKRILRTLIPAVVPVISGRSFLRSTKHHSLSFPLNSR